MLESLIKYFKRKKNYQKITNCCQIRFPIFCDPNLYANGSCATDASSKVLSNREEPLLKCLKKVRKKKKQILEADNLCLKGVTKTKLCGEHKVESRCQRLAPSTDLVLTSKSKIGNIAFRPNCKLAQLHSEEVGYFGK